MSKGPKLDELLDMGEAQARRVMIGTKAELLPLFHLVYADGTSTVVATPWKNDEEKAEAVASVKFAMLKGDVIRYSFLAEAWAISVPQGAEAPKERPRDHPNRVEMVMITACDLKREAIRSLMIERDADGVCTDLVSPGLDTHSVGGVMASLLKPEKGGDL